MLLEEKIAGLFIQKNKTMAVAESCTGGLVAKRLTDIPGSSKFFRAGLITYADEAKIKLLGISPALLKKHGAVSETVAEAMARQVRKKLTTDFGLGITGIAGPTGARTGKPAGLVFIAVNSLQETLCLKLVFSGDRKRIRTQAANTALRLLLEFIS